MSDRIYIGPYDSGSGLQTNYKAMVIPEKAFRQLNEVYVYRGRVRKRPGIQWLGNTQLSTRLRVQVGTLGTPVSPVPLNQGAVGQMFSIDEVVFTVNALGTPANLLVANGSATTAQFNTTSGAFTFTGVRDAGGTLLAGTTPIYWYPALPVMGLISFESSSLNVEPTIAFDTRFAYQYSGVGWERLDTVTNPGDSTWSGTNSQFFQATTWSGAEPFNYILFVTNFNEAEANFMRYLSGTTWTTYRPKVSNIVAPNVNDIWLDSCRMFVVFKNRLLALNTWETSDDGSGAIQRNYSNRARYSQVGSPLDVDAWRQDIGGRGSAIDAPTREQIVGAQFVKDRLIVYFERSTWELVYLGNEAQPFGWQQINTEIGAESSNSIVSFDRVVLGIGQNGIHACNGSNVERIDNAIPQLVFDIRNNNNGIERVYGVRDFFNESVYWSFPPLDATSADPYPRGIIYFNYLNGTWALFKDSITCFGYYQPTNGTLWSSTQVIWNDPLRWGSGTAQANFRQVIGGNQEGFTFIVNPEASTKSGVIQISNVTFVSGLVTVTAVNHNFRQGDYVRFRGIYGDANIAQLNGLIAEVVSPLSSNVFTCNIANQPITTGTYTGGGVLSRVSEIEIKTKEFNFYADKGQNTYVSRIDFLVKRTSSGQITADYFISSSSALSMLQEALATNTEVGTGVLETSAYSTVPFESNQKRVWHPIYFQGDGEYFQLYLRFNEDQLRSTLVDDSDFQLHAMILHTEPTSMRLQ